MYKLWPIQIQTDAWTHVHTPNWSCNNYVLLTIKKGLHKKGNLCLQRWPQLRRGARRVVAWQHSLPELVLAHHTGIVKMWPCLKGPCIWGGKRGRGGWLALEKLNFMQECPYSINIFISKSFKITSISMTLTSGWGGILQKLKPVSNIWLRINSIYTKHYGTICHQNQQN